MVFGPDVSIHRSDGVSFRNDLFNIARTTLSSKVLSQEKDYFANLAVDAVLRLKVRSTVPFPHPPLNLFPISKGSTNLEHIQIIKKVGGKLTDSYLDEGRTVLYSVSPQLANSMSP
jgi:T-complex protein 1 subunit beta